MHGLPNWGCDLYTLEQDPYDKGLYILWRILVLLTSALLFLNPQYFPRHEVRIPLSPESCAPYVPSSHVDPQFVLTLLLIKSLSNGEKEECRKGTEEKVVTCLKPGTQRIH